ncbi:ATP-binding cassette domain-containing protein [Spirillospora sp. CA-294931]|uniref:ATP-binding cassette domain-containing protein n=1 Tax=Spirillospora sp. CA-294931 TaxID=3240042 RepID=UPI003D93250C
MTEPIIEAEGLVRRFGKVEALAGLDLVAYGGQVTAVLGPNGAGKTTFVRSVATLIRPNAGSLRVAGIDVARHPERVRRVIGLAGQYAAVEPTMTGRENLRMVARLFGHSRRQAAANTDGVLDRLGLRDVADRQVKTYSGGLRRRLDLGASLVGAPRLLLLDEPTTGLDPRSRNGLWDSIRDLVALGTDVLLTTQYLDEADQLAGQVAIIDHGRVIADGTPAELKALAGQDMIEVHAHRSADLPSLARALGSIGSGPPRVDAGTNRVSVPVAGGRSAIASATQALGGLDAEVDDIGFRRPTLDEVFLTLTGAPARTPEGETGAALSPAAKENR